MSEKKDIARDQGMFAFEGRHGIGLVEDWDRGQDLVTGWGEGFEDGWNAALEAAREAIQNNHGISERWEVRGPTGAYNAKTQAIEELDGLL